MILSRADRQYEEILARARADAERIRGEAEAEAIAILNRAHARDHTPAARLVDLVVDQLQPAGLRVLHSVAL